MAELVQAKDSFSCSLDDDGRVPYAIGAGDLFAADDEVVKRYPENFRPVRFRDSAEVRRPLPMYPGAGDEVATAGPGERRSLTRPPRKTPERTGTAKATPVPAAAGPSEV